MLAAPAHISVPFKLTPAVATAIDPISTDKHSLFRRPAVGVYVHFPWCLQKCPYCDFLSVPSDREAILHEAYARTVLAELERRKRDIAQIGRAHV